jgi:hypothetical protein
MCAYMRDSHPVCCSCPARILPVRRGSFDIRLTQTATLLGGKLWGADSNQSRRGPSASSRKYCTARRWRCSCAGPIRFRAYGCDVSTEIGPISDELERIEESAMLSGQAQFEQAKFWRGVNLVLGVPASALAAVSGATALATTSGRVAAGIVALVSAGLSAIATTLNASQRTEQAQAAGNLYLALQTDTRIARLTDLPGQDFEGARGALTELRLRQDEINQSAALPAFYAYWRAKRNIRRGGQHYGVDVSKRERIGT